MHQRNESASLTPFDEPRESAMEKRTELLRHGCVVVLVTHVSLLVWAAAHDAPTSDEVAHLPAGLSHWMLGRFDLYRVNPPLVRMVAAVPVLMARPKTDWKNLADDSPGARQEFAVGRDFIAANGARSFWLVTLARWSCIPFSVLGGWICWCWARDLYGQFAAFVSLCLWCFCPPVLAYSHLITPDAPAAAVGLAACYAFWRWLKGPTWAGAFVAGLLLGVAQLTKTTWLVLFFLWPAVGLSVLATCIKNDTLRWAAWGRQTAQLAVAISIGLYVLNLGYLFGGTFQRLGDYVFVSRTLCGPGGEAGYGTAGGNRFRHGILGTIPLPLPRDHVLGIDTQKRDFENYRRKEFWSYLRGEFRPEGWWYSHFYALGVKLPVGTSCLLGLACFLSLAHTHYRSHWRDELPLLVPALAVLALVTSQPSLNHHIRYLLPMLPFAFVWTSKVGRAFDGGHRAVATLACAALVWSVVSGLLAGPHSLSYFNELAGGPTRGHDHLILSNMDLGQDLLYLRRWLDRHPEAKPLGLAYYGFVDPRVAGITFELPLFGATEASPAAAGYSADSLGPRPGWFAVSVNFLRGHRYLVHDGRGAMVFLTEPYYEYFRRFEPVATAGYSIYIYHLDFETTNRVRREMGLPELSRQ